MKSKLKILNVVGARPNFMKIAPIAEAIEAHNQANRDHGIESLIVHTGQHYDEQMSKLFFEDLDIPRPDYNLGVGSGSHAYQTAEIMKRFEPVLEKERPDYILVVGDVNSTIACALVAKKLGVKVIHVEAGLRSFDMSMPEEINRILTDAISDLLFITEKSGETNLLKEGVTREKIHFVGNVMIDTLLRHKEKAECSEILVRVGLAEKGDLSIQPYAVLTLHRPSNVDDPMNLENIMKAVTEISRHLPVVFPVHPRTKKQMVGLNIGIADTIKLVDPLGYLDFLKLMSHARMVLTDSGGIQEETTVLGVPCITLRENTERPVTVEQGTNVIVGMERKNIVDQSLKVLNGNSKEGRLPELWDGKAAERIVEVLAGESPRL